MEQLYWLWFSLAFGPGNPKALEILKRYPNPRDFYDTVQHLKKPMPPLTEADFAQLRKTTLDDAQKTAELCDRKKLGIVTMRDRIYPQRLLQIQVPPVLLYTFGDISSLNRNLVISMVGSREVTSDGYTVGKNIAETLAAHDIVVVSGLALGGDSSAHYGALNAHGSTIAVIACGCDIDYPSLNRKLHEQIARQGGILSEFAPGTRPLAGNFRIRNRILSGVANGVIVTQCGERSGALNTAGHALEQGRDVFAVPSAALDMTHGGTFKLLQDGAIPVRTGFDVLDYYHVERKKDFRLQKDRPAFPPSRRQPLPDVQPAPVPTVPSAAPESVAPAVKPQPEKAAMLSPAALPDEPKPSPDVPMQDDESLPNDLGENARAVWALLGEQPVDMDTLAASAAIPSDQILPALVELECAGLCKSLPGQRYTR